MIDFGKVWQAMVFINIAILMANFAGVFPEKWSPYLKGIEETYNQIQDELNKIQNISEQDILANLGSWGFITLITMKLVVQLTLLSPYYVSITLSNLFASLGIPGELAYGFMVITYFSFAIWIADIIRGRVINIGEY